MKDCIKDFGKGLLIALVLNVLISLGLTTLLLFLHPETFTGTILQNFLHLFLPIFSWFSVGLLLFGLMFVVYNKLDGKKPALTLSIGAALLLIIVASFMFFEAFAFAAEIFSSTSIGQYSYLIILLSIIIVSLLGLTLFLFKVVKENKRVILAIIIWFLITVIYYLFPSFIFKGAILGG